MILGLCLNSDLHHEEEGGLGGSGGGGDEVLSQSLLHQGRLLLGSSAEEAALDDVGGELVLTEPQHVAPHLLHDPDPVLRRSVLHDVLHHIVACKAKTPSPRAPDALLSGLLDGGYRVAEKSGTGTKVFVFWHNSHPKDGNHQLQLEW